MKTQNEISTKNQPSMSDQQPSSQGVLNLFGLLEAIRKQSVIIVFFACIALGLGALVTYSS